MEIHRPIVLLLFFLFSGLSLSAQETALLNGFKRSPNKSIQYKIIKDSIAPALELGGAAFVYLSYQNAKDTFSSVRMGIQSPIGIKIDTINKGGFEEVFPLFSAGDSVCFIIRNDILYKNVFVAELPQELKPEGTTFFNIKFIKTISRDSVILLEKNQRQKQMAIEESRQQQAKTDSITIRQYCKKHKLKPKLTYDGVFYVIQKEAKGVTLQPGDTAATFYTGKFLDGKTFDSNVGKEPFLVPIAMGVVIRGWDSVLMALKEGEKATVIIPSHLAYGERGAGSIIPPNTILIFDIEILKR